MTTTTATATHEQLSQIGRSLVRWRAQINLSWCLGALLAVLCVLGFADLWLRLDQPSRFVAWGLLLGVVAFSGWLLARTLRKRFSDEGVAADIEKTFPELDNRLINFLQFSRDTGNDALKKAYVAAGAPSCSELDLRRMRDEKAHRRSLLFLAVATALLLLPALFIGKAWGVTLWRTINPFATTAPPSLTKIVSVEPGDTTALQGEPLLLSCTAAGFKGHEVQVEIVPQDGARKTYSLGLLKSANEEETFSQRIPKIATGLRYRFRAGDSPNTRWYEVDSRIPPAYTAAEISVTPPAYTRREATAFDLREGSNAVVPEGAEVAISVKANTELQSCNLVTPSGEAVTLTPAAGGLFTGKATISAKEDGAPSDEEGGAALRLVAVDSYGLEFSEDFAIRLETDRGPAIEIVSPSGSATLPPGEFPQIQFRVSDEYGLVEARVEEVRKSAAGETEGVAQRTWTSPGAPSLEQIWTGSRSPARGGQLTFRVVARDNRPDSPNETISSPIVFNAPTHEEAAKQQRELEEKAFVDIKKLVAMQKQNISQTQNQLKNLKDTPDAGWIEAADRQQEIRTITKELLANPVKPLGGLTSAVKDLYVGEMLFATDALRAIPTVAKGDKAGRASEALLMEKKILRQLTYAESSASQTGLDRRTSGLLSMLEAMVREQGEVLEQTRAFADAEAKIGTALIDAQDALASDLTGFLNTCQDESEAVRGSDEAFANTLVAVVTLGGKARIRENMVIAAERLDENDPAAAISPEEGALASLKELLAMLESMEMENEAEKQEVMLDALADAKENLGKIKELHTEMLDAMEDIRGATDKNTEEIDYMEEAYEELLKNTKESLLEIPTDLHVFTDLNVANDVVEDVISVFEEIEQAGVEEGEEPSAADVVEQAYAKEDILLEMMEEAEDRIDDMEMWLGETADEIKVTTEAFDREEMPESGIATGALSTEVEDMIGDLLEENEEANSEADDSATTHAMPDMEMGWEVMEGDISSFAAKGKSGNDTPDHKEQDGRSNVGRQGMSVGETAAGSGTISEGDKNIEERRTEDPTQSGQIDLEGEADTKATGGGKLGTGKADGKGMGGGLERMDSSEEGSEDGMAALMARQADALYAKASMKNVRVDSLKSAAHHLRQASDAIAKGNIEQVGEHRRLALAALRRSKASLDAGPSGALDTGGASGVLDDVVETGPDQAPPQFRDQVADYYKALNQEL